MDLKNFNTESAQLNEALTKDPLLLGPMQAEEKRRNQRLRFRVAGVVIVLVVASIGLMVTQSGFASPAESATSEGWKLWQQRKLIEAEEKFVEATKLEPKSVNAWNGLGWARVNQGKDETALTAFKTCLKLQPAMPAALNGAGQALLAQGKLDEAKDYLTKAAPQASAAWYGLARIALLEENYEDAQKWSRKTLNLDPSNIVAQKMLKAAEEKSLSSELRSLIEPPKGKTREAMHAWQIFKKGDMVQAKELFQQALKKNPNNLSAMNGLAFCYLNLGEVAEAKPLFEKCIEQEKNALGAMNGLARCLKAEGDTAGAIKIWQEMEKQTVQVSAATVGLANTYLERGEFETALKYFERLVAAAPQNAAFKTGLNAAQAGLQK